MKKLFLSLAAVIIIFSSCGNNKNYSEKEDAYWRDTLSIRDSAFTFFRDSIEIDVSLMIPAKAVKSPLVILQSVRDKDFSIGGIGHTDKDTTLSEPYKDIAIGLAQNGIATLRVGNIINQPTSTQTFIDAMEKMNADLKHALNIAQTLKSVDTTHIYIFSMSNLFISEVIKQHPGIKGVVIASTPSRPLMEGIMEMLQTLAKKDTVWESSLREMERQYNNLQKLETKEFNDRNKLPSNLTKEEWKKLKNYSLADEIKFMEIPVLILQGKGDISLSQQEFDTWKTKLADRSNTTYKQYEDLTLLFLAPANIAKNKPRHVPVYVINDIAKWIKSINHN